MKSYIYSFLLSLLLTLSFFGGISNVSAGAVAIDGIQNFNNKIQKNTITAGITVDADPIKTIEATGKSILTTIKTIISGLLVIMIVYSGGQMIMSMGTDEEMLSSGKRQLWYTIIGFIFINIPGAIFNAFNSNTSTTIDTRTSYSSWFKTPGQESNLFYDAFSLGNTLNNDIIGFMEILVSFITILVIIMAGIKMITSQGEEEAIKESKSKIIWSLISLILVGFIESWKYLVFSGEISDGTSFFETLTNLLFFFAGPIAMVFLTIAAYTYITANGDDEKVKKAKSIVTNVVLATIILLASYTFLLDLITL